MYMSVASAIREYLKSHGIKQSFVAEKCGWSRQKQNTRILMDRLNRSAYGMTWDEMIRLLCGRREEETHDTGRD